MLDQWSIVCGPNSPLADQPAWLVGGCVRDQLLGRPIKDYDLVVTGDVWQLAGELARQLAASCFWLDRERGIARVAGAGLDFHLDLCRLNGASLEDDLRQRDFTINAIARELNGASFIDPLNGRADLAQGLIRLVCATALIDDPLRILRALRFSLLPGFRLEPATAAAIRRSTGRLGAIAAERIRQELMSCLQISGAIFKQLADFELMEPVLGCETGDYEALAGGEDLLASQRLSGSADHFSAEIEGGVRRADLLRLCLFCGPAAPQVLARLKFSKRSQRLAEILVRQLGRLTEATPGDAVARYRWLRDAEGCVPELLIAAHRRLPAIDELWAYYRGPFSALQPLLTGDDLKHLPGPQIGAVLRAASELQACGQLETRDQALEWVRQGSLKS